MKFTHRESLEREDSSDELDPFPEPAESEDEDESSESDESDSDGVGLFLFFFEVIFGRDTDLRRRPIAAG